MTFTLEVEQRRKILTPAVLRLMQAVQGEGELRVVGGAVRDAVLGRKIGDIDLACNLPPQRVMEILAAQKIKTVPTGLAHGTITAVIDHNGYEITTLRRDVATDGRHATVAFTDDWRVDAERRDFTFNALYLDQGGAVTDYFNGVADAKAGHVRFIGDAQARIREDVLRILRFFRFYAWFGQGAPDTEAVAACKILADLIPTLSAERVARETLKLLAAEKPWSAWQAMIECKAHQPFTAEATDLARLQVLLENEKAHAQTQSPVTRLAALLPPDEKTALAVAARLKLANRDGEALLVLAKLPGLLRPDLSAKAVRRLLYVYGPDSCRAALFLNGQQIAETLPVIDNWENPVFPIKGEDIVKRGISAGPRIGDILRRVEQSWIDSDFRADRAACLMQAEQYGKNH